MGFVQRGDVAVGPGGRWPALIPAAILAIAILGLVLVYRPAARRALGN